MYVFFIPGIYVMLTKFFSPQSRNLVLLHLLFLFLIMLFTYLTVLGLLCCTGFSLVAGNRGHSLVVARGLLMVVASLVVEHRL